MALCAALFISQGPALGSEAPSFQLSTLQGERVSLKELTRDRHLILIFWSTTCPKCSVTMPRLDKLAAEYDRSELRVLGVNPSRYSTKKSNQSFREEHGIGFPLALDQEGKVARSYMITGYPTLLLIDPKGRILYRGYGVSERLRQAMEGI